MTEPAISPGADNDRSVSLTRTEHLLSCLAEECAEVAQRVSKALRFSLDEVQPGQSLTNAKRIVQELLDLMGVVEAHKAKRLKVEKFMAYAKSLGVLRDRSPGAS